MGGQMSLLPPPFLSIDLYASSRWPLVSAAIEWFQLCVMD